MHAPKLIRFSLVLLATLSASGAAWARRPPSLVAAQERAESAQHVCPHHAKSAAYRGTAEATARRSACSTLRNVGGRLTHACAYRAPSAAQSSTGYRAATAHAAHATRARAAAHSCCCG